MAEIHRIASEDVPPYRARTARPKASDPQTWPVVWRVVAPCAGSFDRDMVLCQTEDEDEARSTFKTYKRSNFPVRLEIVHCGPLPKGYMERLRELWAANAQKPGSEMGPILGAWTTQERQS